MNPNSTLCPYEYVEPYNKVLSYQNRFQIEPIFCSQKEFYMEMIGNQTFVRFYIETFLQIGKQRIFKFSKFANSEP